MHVFADSEVLASLAPKEYKGNNGKASRRLLLRKTLLIIVVACVLMSCLYFIRNGKGFAGRMRRQKIKKAEKDEKFTGRKRRQTIEKGEIEKQKSVEHSAKLTPLQGSRRDSKQDSDTIDEEEGRLITFYVSNLEGSPENEGTFTIRTRPSWSPKGAKRFEELTEQLFWDECRFFRAIKNFVVQWGINGDPETKKKWRGKTLQDEKVKASNKRGTVVFAKSGPNTRTTQMYINTGNKNQGLDKEGFSPIGEVIDGMDTVDKIYTGYGGNINQGQIQTNGNKYLNDKFPKLSFIRKALFKPEVEAQT